MFTILFDTVNYLFWFFVWHTFQWVRYIVVQAAPQSLVRKLVTDFMAKEKIKVTMAGDKNIGKYDREKYTCEMVIHNPKFFKWAAADDVMAFGEGYMDEWWDGDAREFFRCISKRRPQTLPMYLSSKLLAATNKQTPALSFKVIQEHYNLGNDIYEAMLDPTMNYTCAYWKEDTKTLEEAQINKMELVARKLKLKPGMKVLDIGCGFGATAKYLASKYKVSVVGYNISTEQVAYARKSCAGLDVEFRLEDYRNATGQYDAVYSVGIFEHVGHKNFRGYFEVCDRCLKPEGIALVHCILVSDIHSRTARWLNKYIFPGGELPYMHELITSAKELFVVEDVQSFAKCYIKTLDAWYKNFNENWPGDLETKYAGLIGGRFKRMWNYYLLVCEGGFDSRAVQLAQVVYTKFDREAEYKSVRID